VTTDLPLKKEPVIALQSCYTPILHCVTAQRCCDRFPCHPKMCLLWRDRILFRCSDTATPNSPRNRIRSRQSEFHPLMAARILWNLASQNSGMGVKV